MSTKHHTENEWSSNKKPTKTVSELMCSGSLSGSCPTSDNPVLSHEWGKERIMITTNGTYSLSTQIFLLMTCCRAEANIINNYKTKVDYQLERNMT